MWYGMECGNNVTGFLGALFPVYSNDKDTIYKNRICAICNNATDLVEFKTVVTVLSGNYPRTELLNRIVEGDVEYTIDFIPPRMSGGVRNLQCYVVGLIDSCMGFLTVRSPIISTSIYSACRNGMISPFNSPLSKKIYKNYYCALCNNEDLTTVNCSMDLTALSQPDNALVAVLDPNIVDRYIQQKENGVPLSEKTYACESGEISEDWSTVSVLVMSCKDNWSKYHDTWYPWCRGLCCLSIKRD